MSWARPSVSGFILTLPTHSVEEVLGELHRNAPLKVLEPEDTQPQDLDSCYYQGGRIPLRQASQKVVKLNVDFWICGCPLVWRQILSGRPSGRFVGGVNPDGCSHVRHYPLHVVEPGSRDRSRYLLLVLGGVDEGVQERCWRGLTACQGVLPLLSAPQFPVLPGAQAGPYGLGFCIGDPGNLQIYPGFPLCLIQSIPLNAQPSAAFPGECFVQSILGC